MTMDELNALYNNMSVYGDTYTTPITTIPKDPNAGQSPILEPLIPIVKQLGPVNQGGDNDKGGITSIAPATYEQTYDPNLNFAEFTSGVKGIPSFTQEYTERPGGIQSLLDLYTKYSPMANIMKLGKTGIETVQKYFADKKEDQRLKALAQIEQARKQKEAQAIIAAAEEQATREAATAARARAANPNVYASADAQGFTSGGGGFASQNTGTNENFSNNTGKGRTGYGTGGIVSL